MATDGTVRTGNTITGCRPEDQKTPGPFQDNLFRLQEMRKEARLAGGIERIEDQHRKGKLTARERVELLLDEGSFEEFDMLKAGSRGPLGGDQEHHPAFRSGDLSTDFLEEYFKSGISNVPDPIEDPLDEWSREFIREPKRSY